MRKRRRFPTREAEGAESSRWWLATTIRLILGALLKEAVDEWLRSHGFFS